MKAQYKVVVDSLVSNQRDYLESFVYPQYYASHAEAIKFYDRLLGLIREGFKFIEFRNKNGSLAYNVNMIRGIKICMVTPDEDGNNKVNDDCRIEVRGV
jgi:hypothetical protein